MGKFSGVLLASDYDDTLYDSRGIISRENRAAIDYFIREGGLFTIATGRSYENFAIQMEAERLPLNAPAVLSNGASIHDFSLGKTLWQCCLPPVVGTHMAQLCQDFDQLGVEAYHEDKIYTYRANAATRWHLKKCFLTGLPRARVEEIPGPWVKAILQHPETSYRRRVRQALMNRWPDRYEATFSNDRLLELTARGVDKGRAVQRLAGELGIHAENLYCVGNGINDIPMLAVSAVPFAPADCYQEVVDWGATLLPACDESCIAVLIDILDQRYE